MHPQVHDGPPIKRHSVHSERIELLKGDTVSNSSLNRRNFLKGLGVFAGTAIIGSDLIPALGKGSVLAQQTEALAGPITNRPWYTMSFTGDPLMDERVLFYLGHAWYQMSEIGECLDTASRITAGDTPGWRREWFSTADRLRRVAETSLAGGHEISAGESYLRATSYYLAGLIYMDSPDDPELPRTARAVAECFEDALHLLKIPGETVQIPYENGYLPGYYFRSANTSAPLLIVHQGMDASIEETYFVAQGALALGYNCLMFHHPGQGLALREHGFTFRPDWENVITPVVDFALGLPGVDIERLALLGLSFGGALALRAAAFEPRLKICISNPPIYDWGSVVRQQLFGEYPQLEGLLDTAPDAFNLVISEFLKDAPAIYRWWINASMWKFGQETPAALVQHLQQYSLEGMIERITCKVLIMDGEAESYGSGDGQKIHAMLPNSDYMLFTAEDTALLHNQTAALAVANQRMFDWLDENI